MAKVNAEFDTVSKVLTISVDGKAVPDVTGLSIYKRMNWEDEEGYSCCIQSMTENEDDDTKHYYNMVASESEAGVQAAKAGAVESVFKGFIVAEEVSSLVKDVDNYFGR